MYIIGIAGGSGSGKTTFAKKVLKNMENSQVELLHMDSYYLHNQPTDLMTGKGQPNFDHPDAFDWDLLRDHISILRQGHTIQKPIYDFETNSRTTETVEVGPCKMIIFEGIFTLYDKAIRSMLDIKCFLHVEADIRFTRRLHRDVKERGRTLESVIGQYYDTVRPMYQKYLAPQKDQADFIVGEETDNAAHILAARLKELLN
jgi:uridine kinase